MPSRWLVALLAALLVGAPACGSSSSGSASGSGGAGSTGGGSTSMSAGQAKDSLCTASADISKQLDDLAGMASGTATLAGVTASLTAIKADLQTITDALPSLAADTRQKATSATATFKSDVQKAAADLTAGTVSRSDLKQQLAQSSTMLQSSFADSLSNVGCPG
jgi:hypothetical protein